jgi:glutathione S-transferase
MVQLATSDILTREVLDWRGLHLFHARFSSCSIKTRIFLNLRGGAWTSHPVDLRADENWSPWFLGINPRGLVPVLVADGAVHIESNDILAWLDTHLPGERLIPEGMSEDMAALLRHEDDLHIDLRTVSFRFNRPAGTRFKSAELIDRYRNTGSGTVQGQHDPDRDRELAFYEAAAEGIPLERARSSLAVFDAEFRALDATLARQAFLLGDRLGVLDIAWWVYVDRLTSLGYPLATRRPHLDAWYQRLKARPEFAREIARSDAERAALAAILDGHAARGESMADLLGA